jgi:hypothetical protein
MLLTSCAGSGLLEAELPDDGPLPPTSTAAARRFAEKAVAAGESVGGAGYFTIDLTEEEVTSFLNIGVVLLQRFQSVPLESVEQLQSIPELEGIDDLERWQELLDQRERLPDLGGGRLRLRLRIEEPAVHFRSNGHIIVRGSIRFMIVDLPVRIVAAPRASRGEIVLDFVEGQLGPVPMPEFVFDYLGRQLSRAILAGREYGEITEITVGDGVLTISGRRHQ